MNTFRSFQLPDVLKFDEFPKFSPLVCGIRCKMVEDEFEQGVPEYFAGQRVFLTGGTGFMGKVLIEKLLRSCPDIDKIYVLVRPKKGKVLKERLEVTFQNALFDKLKKEQPNALWEKVIPVAGDVIELDLGLSGEDRETLKENVTLVYHVAASVRFDQPLNEAIIMNTRGTREICKLALEMKKLQVFMHISTAYCHTDKKVVEERMYPPYADWKKSIEIAEKMDKSELQVIAPLYMQGFPNTYTFTKSMAENIVNDMLDGHVPNVIVRPSIVICTHKDPMPGWIDNFNGPVGILVGCGSGLIRINLLANNIVADYVAVDSAIKGIILGTWQQGIKKTEDRLVTKVYNCSSNGLKSVTMDEMIDMAHEIVWDTPLSTCIWYPSNAHTSSFIVYYVCVLFFHLLPAIFLDTLLRLFKKKPMIVRIQRKVYIATMALQYFLFNDWKFLNHDMISLQDKLQAKDLAAFAYDVDGIDVREFCKAGFYGAKKWLLNESLDHLESHRQRLKILYYLDKLVQFSTYGLMFYYLCIKYCVPAMIYNMFLDYLETLP